MSICSIGKTSSCADFPPATGLFLNGSSASSCHDAPSFSGKTAGSESRSALTEQLKELAQKEEAIFIHGLAELLSKALVFRYTQQEDLIVCSSPCGRPQPR
jgi:hypothetical protein